MQRKKLCSGILQLLLLLLLVFVTVSCRRKEEQYLFIGDSYAAKLESAGYSKGNVKIWAVPGLTVRQIYEMREDFPVPEDENRPDKVVLMAGINTLAESQGEIEITDHQDLICYLRDHYGVPVYVQKVFPVGEPLLQHKPGLSAENVAEYNRKLEGFCEENEDVIFFDPQKGFVDENGYLLHTEDNLHIAEDYQEQYYRNIMAEVK